MKSQKQAVLSVSNGKSCVALLLVCLIVAPSTGCGEPTSSVYGTVSYEGAEIQKGMITFSPADGKGSSVGCDIKGGKYSASGLKPGKTIFNVVAVKDVTFARNSEDMASRAKSQNKNDPIQGLIDPADIIPDNAVGNNASHDLAPGGNKIDLKLTKP